MSFSPVLGLRPSLALRLRTSKLPNGINCTFSPFASALFTLSRKLSTMSVTSRRGSSVFVVISSISSALVIGHLSDVLQGNARNFALTRGAFARRMAAPAQPVSGPDRDSSRFCASIPCLIKHCDRSAEREAIRLDAKTKHTAVDHRSDHRAPAEIGRAR